MKLTTLAFYIEFLLEELNTVFSHGAFEFVRRVKIYKDFLNQPLTLGMFVPCDLEGNVLQMPDVNFYQCAKTGLIAPEYEYEAVEYQQAQERVLFKGFTHVYKNTYSVIKYKDREYIENLFFAVRLDIEGLIKLNLELTPNAIKQLK